MFYVYVTTIEALAYQDCAYILNLSNTVLHMYIDYVCMNWIEQIEITDFYFLVYFNQMTSEEEREVDGMFPDEQMRDDLKLELILKALVILKVWSTWYD